jgi:Dna[CI] antecedent DciA-like protein
MVPLPGIAARVAAEIIRHQPPSQARTEFAWGIAVGAALARASTVELANGVLHVRARDARWSREIERNRDVILERLRNLLGDVSDLDICASQ